MKKKNNPLTAILLLVSILCISGLIFCNYEVFENVCRVETNLSLIRYSLPNANKPINKANELLDTVEKQNKQKKDETKQTESTYQTTDLTQMDEIEQTETNPSSVFAQANDSVSNGYIIGIDPGHQSFEIDMSEMEPLGPGSSEMKAKASTGTAGTYTGLPEYQLNLDVSLMLRDILESRGYQVVLTRENNETAISNRERAELAASQGADIYVRIHANGEDSNTMSGALTMAPSPQNPYVAHLSNDSVKLSQCIIDSYCEATGFQNLGVQYYDNMTGINWSTIPVTIVEMGFMTHEYDDTTMNDPAFQMKMAEGIANGIDAYFQ